MARAASKKWFRIFWLSALGIVVLAATAVTFYVMYLDGIVTKQFEGRRWTLPAQVYAAPLELYVGLALNGSDLEHELQRLQYRRVDKLEHPGTYRLQGTRLDIALRPARFADETRPASILSVVSSDKGIESLRDSDGKDVPPHIFTGLCDQPCALAVIRAAKGQRPMVLEIGAAADDRRRNAIL